MYSRLAKTLPRTQDLLTGDSSVSGALFPRLLALQLCAADFALDVSDGQCEHITNYVEGSVFFTHHFDLARQSMQNTEPSSQCLRTPPKALHGPPKGPRPR